MNFYLVKLLFLQVTIEYSLTLCFLGEGGEKHKSCTCCHNITKVNGMLQLSFIQMLYFCRASVGGNTGERKKRGERFANSKF